MNEHFFELKQEKQDRIINAALKVFARYGYDHAGTDEIVKEASISKGLLFHYFGSKIGTYSFVYDYSVRYMVLQLNSYVNETETNYFRVWEQAIDAQFRILELYPYMLHFLVGSLWKPMGEELEAIRECRERFLTVYEKLWQQALGLKAEDEEPEEHNSSAKEEMDKDRILRYAMRGILEDHLFEENMDIAEMKAEMLAVVQRIENYEKTK